jgi:micrococcal nuclease
VPSLLPAALIVLPACHRLADLPILPVQDATVCAADREEPVQCVLDGDTIGVQGSEADGADPEGAPSCATESVRLLGVDAPEVAHDPDPADCYGDEAAAYLSNLVSNATVRLEFDSECYDTYRRSLAYVYLVPDPGDDDTGSADEVFVNEDLIVRGYATFYEEFSDIRQADRLRAAQSSAQDAGNGLWSACAS